MPIKTTITTEQPSKVEADVLVVLVRDKKIIASLPPHLEKELRGLMKSFDFEGNWGTASLFAARTSARASFLAVVGLGGKNDELNNQAEALRRAMGKIVQEARTHNVKHIALDLMGEPEVETFARAAIEAVELANYRFTDFSDKKRERQEKRSLRQLTILVDEPQQRSARSTVRLTQKIIEGVKLARDLVNRPAEYMSPEALVLVAKEIEKNNENISLRVMDQAAAEKEGFSAFLAVAQGSVRPPYVIHLVYKPLETSATDRKKVFIIGKGITFDSGGLSLKPSGYMETMKMDMAGAATVLALFSVINEVAPKIEVHGIVPACENMPSGSAYRPGDVVRAKNGKTIEVINTDAEGRITLADALSYAVEQGADAIIDVATLTGACMVALGETIAGLWSNDNALKDALRVASYETGEQIEDLPMPLEYRSRLESDIADLRNVSKTRYGDALLAAMFLREFVSDKPWAHIDIAGPAFVENIYLPYYTYGATGFGVRMLAEFLKKY